MRLLKIITLMSLLSLGMVSCGSNTSRNLQICIDANNFIKGKFKGYATGVYKIDLLNNSYERVNGELLEYKVYLKDGEYTIDFNGDTYVLQKVSHPIDLFGTGVYIFKWKFDQHYYIEDIPHSY